MTPFAKYAELLAATTPPSPPPRDQKYRRRLTKKARADVMKKELAASEYAKMYNVSVRTINRAWGGGG